MTGKLFILVGPSGSGKSSVLKELKKLRQEWVYPLSATTRPLRPGEKDGEVYHFYSVERFKKGIENGEFIEYAVVHQDHYYGLLLKPVLEALKEGKIVVREIDIQGLGIIKEKIPPQNLIAIFITAPSKEELIERIVSRAPISQHELEKRKESMHKEFAQSKDCDYLVENRNGELGKTVETVIRIIESEVK